MIIQCTWSNKVQFPWLHERRLHQFASSNTLLGLLTARGDLLVLLLGQMHPKLNGKCRVTRLGGSAVRLDMIYDGAAPAAVLSIEHELFVRPQDSVGVGVPEREFLTTLQESIMTSTTRNDPVIPRVAFHIRPKGRHLLLTTQWAANKVGMKVLLCGGVAQTDLLPALNWSASFGDRCAGGHTYYPEGVNVALLRGQRYNLLTRSRGHILARASEIVLSAVCHVTKFDRRTVGNVLRIGVNIGCRAPTNEVQREERK